MVAKEVEEPPPILQNATTSVDFLNSPCRTWAMIRTTLVKDVKEQQLVQGATLQEGGPNDPHPQTKSSAHSRPRFTTSELILTMDPLAWVLCVCVLFHLLLLLEGQYRITCTSETPTPGTRRCSLNNFTRKLY